MTTSPQLSKDELVQGLRQSLDHCRNGSTDWHQLQNVLEQAIEYLTAPAAGFTAEQRQALEAAVAHLEYAAGNFETMKPGVSGMAENESRKLRAQVKLLRQLRAPAAVEEKGEADLTDEQREACRFGAAGLRGDLASMRRIIGGDYGRMHAYQTTANAERILRGLAGPEQPIDDEMAAISAQLATTEGGK
jgi:hypothetical protein